MQVIQLKLKNPLQNYNYILFCEDRAECLLLDPLESSLVNNEIKNRNLRPVFIVNTHEHSDHTLGNEFFAKNFSLPVFAHKSLAKKVPYFSQGLDAGDFLYLGEDKIQVLYTPGHTNGHICLFCEKENPMLFCGDTLFHAGVGNCYHGGDVFLLYKTFEQIIFQLPKNTIVYPGHYYLEKNLRFGLSLLPDDLYILKAYENFKRTQSDVRYLKDEFESNVFFRLDDANLRQSLWEKGFINSKDVTNFDVFFVLRKLRDNF